MIEIPGRGVPSAFDPLGSMSQQLSYADMQSAVPIELDQDFAKDIKLDIGKQS